MKNIQVIDGAVNATFSVFQASDEEFALIFPDGRDMEFVEDLIDRLGERQAGQVLGSIWDRPILKRDIQGLHGTLFYDWADRKAHYPTTKREVDWNPSSISEAQRLLFRANR